MLKPIPLCPMEPRPADTWPGSLKDIRDRLDDHVADRNDPHGTLAGERVKAVVGEGAAEVSTDPATATVTVKVPAGLSGFENDAGYVTSSKTWPQSSVDGLSAALESLSGSLAAKASLEDGKVPPGQIPDEFDEVLFRDSPEFINGHGAPGKLYVDMSRNKLYRWNGVTFAELSSWKEYVDATQEAASADLASRLAGEAAALQAAVGRKQDRLDERQLAAVNSGATSEKLANLVAKDDVQPQGDGTVVVATIGGKEIKAPAGSVSSVNNKTGDVVLDGEDIDVGAGDSRSVTKAFNDLESSFIAHAGNGENPHGVTADQIGAQKKLTAGANITITPGGVISASGGSSVVESATNPGYAAHADAALSVPWSGVRNIPEILDGSVINYITSSFSLWYTTESGDEPVVFYDEAQGEWRLNGFVNWGYIWGKPNTVDGFGITDAAKKSEVNAVSSKVDAIEDAVNVNNRFLVGDTTASIQTRESDDSEWSDEIRVDKGYDALTGDAMVKLDKSVQTVTVRGSNLEIVLPDAVAGTVRDFCVYANNSGDADTALTFPPGTYYGDDPNGAVAKAGKVTGVYLSEIPNGVWILGIRELEQHEVTA